MRLTKAEHRALHKGGDCDRIVLSRITVMPGTAESLVALGLWSSFEEYTRWSGERTARRYRITPAGRAALTQEGER